MPRYYCDYCDTYLTHDSPSVRKQHNAGYKHKANVRTYYQQFEEQQTQSLIDQRIKEHLGQAAAFQQQVGAAYNQHLLSQRPPSRLPILPTPVMPLLGGAQLPPINAPFPGMRPPVFPRPLPGAPGYIASPTMPPMVAPPGPPSFPGQINGVPRLPTGIAPTVPRGVAAPAPSSGAPSMVPPVTYQSPPVTSAGGGFDNFNLNAPGPEVNH